MPRNILITHVRQEPGFEPDINIIAYYEVDVSQVRQLVADQIAVILDDWGLSMFSDLKWKRRGGAQESWSITAPPEVGTQAIEHVTIHVIDPETWLDNQFRDPTEEQGEG